MPDAFIAVDLGAQSGRVMLGVFATSGFTLHEIARFANRPIERDGVRCWDVDALFGATIEGIADAVSGAGRLGASVRGIGVDSWGVDYGLVDVQGNLTAPVRHYRAARSEHMEQALQLVPADEAYARTGIIGLPINTGYQLYRDAELDLLNDDVTVLLIPDLWTFLLTGERGAERTIASTTGVMNRTTGDWDLEILQRLGIPMGAMPPLRHAGTIAGHTTAEITDRIGADSPIPVIRVPAHDTASAFAAVADPDDGRVVISCGTWALVGCLTADACCTPQAQAAGFTNEEGADGAITFIRNLSGTWLLEECIGQWAEESQVAVPELRSELLAQASMLAPFARTIDVGATELLDPGDMPRRIAAAYARIAPDEPALTREQLVRLIIDSLAAEFAITVRDAQALTGQPLTAIHMIGGGSNIPLLVEQTARATGLHVTLGHTEATSIGNICVQAVASGMMPTIAAARQAATTTMEATP